MQNLEEVGFLFEKINKNIGNAKALLPKEWKTEWKNSGLEGQARYSYKFCHENVCKTLMGSRWSFGRKFGAAFYLDYFLYEKMNSDIGKIVRHKWKSSLISWCAFDRMLLYK